MYKIDNGLVGKPLNQYAVPANINLTYPFLQMKMPLIFSSPVLFDSGINSSIPYLVMVHLRATFTHSVIVDMYVYIRYFCGRP